MATNEYCMIGVGAEVIIPKERPMQNVPVRTRTNFKKAAIKTLFFDQRKQIMSWYNHKPVKHPPQHPQPPNPPSRM